MRGMGSTEKFQTVGLQRKPQQAAYVAQEIRVSIVARLREHGDGIQRVAKQNGLTVREAVDVLIEQTELERRAAYNRGVAVGRLMGTFPIRPVDQQMKRAA